jgi:hypothetical protein
VKSLPKQIQDLIGDDVINYINLHIDESQCKPVRFSMVELFAGSARMTYWFNKVLSEPATAWDLIYGNVWQQVFDITTIAGMATAVALLVHTKPGGMAWMSPACSSWIMMSMHTTGRSMRNVWGKPEFEKVRLANIAAKRVSVLCIIAGWLKVWVVVEQPTSSLMFNAPIMASMMNCASMQGYHVWAGAYGAASAKGLRLVSNAPWLAELSNRKCIGKPIGENTKLVKKYQSLTSERVFYSGKKQLKESEVYPWGLCEAVADLWKKHSTEAVPAFTVLASELCLNMETGSGTAGVPMPWNTEQRKRDIGSALELESPAPLRLHPPSLRQLADSTRLDSNIIMKLQDSIKRRAHEVAKPGAELGLFELISLAVMFGRPWRLVIEGGQTVSLFEMVKERIKQVTNVKVDFLEFCHNTAEEMMAVPCGNDFQLLGEAMTGMRHYVSSNSRT